MRISFLFLRSQGNKTRTKINRKSNDGMSSLYVASPIKVAKGFEFSSIICWLEEIETRSTLNVTKDTSYYLLMCSSGSINKLTNMLYNICNIRLSIGQIDQSTN